MSSGEKSPVSENMLLRIRRDRTFRKLKARYESDPDTLLHSIIHYAYCDIDFFEVHAKPGKHISPIAQLLVTDGNKCVQLFDEPMADRESTKENMKSPGSSGNDCKESVTLPIDMKNLFIQMGFAVEKVENAIQRFNNYEYVLDFLLGKRTAAKK
uniref:UBA domain-containing protein n=1 Tax=Romanomermis culicivorax TaxID=13658 RepID=A0A915JVA6_ROMCU